MTNIPMTEDLPDRLVTLIDQGLEPLERALLAIEARVVDDNDAVADVDLAIDLYEALTGTTLRAWIPCPTCGAQGPDESCSEHGHLIDDHEDRGSVAA